MFIHILKVLAEDLYARGQLDLSECFTDGTFVPAKKGGVGVGKAERGKGSKVTAIADRAGLPVAVYESGASAHESQLVEPTLATCFVADEPQRLIGDKAYDSDP